MVVGMHLCIPTRDRSRDTCPSIYNREKVTFFRFFQAYIPAYMQKPYSKVLLVQQRISALKKATENV